MRSKKTLYFAWMLVFMVLVCAGCLEKEVTWKNKTIKKLESRIEAVSGPEFAVKVENLGMKKRSLALYIAEDHAELAALFVTKQFDQMAVVMGTGILDTKVKLSGKEMESLEAISAYWAEQHKLKEDSLEDDEKEKLGSMYSIELQIWSESITIGQYPSVRAVTRTVYGEPVEYKFDGKSIETFKFNIVLKELKNGNILSNNNGEGEWPRGHSEECPWI